EAAMFAGDNKLSNLTAVIDRNNIQITGNVEDTLPLEGLRAKYEAFNWHVLECDGHNIPAFIEMIEEAKAISEKPTVIIAHTIAGRGIPSIEGDYRYHGYAPSGKAEVEKLLAELRAQTHA
ncbi:transketolase, partial [Candidatus Parcubacteria bacterium]|nr:transketolase [Candidatus Parcubacteria bacterium]